MQDCWLPTPLACFPFTSPPVRHRVPPDSACALPTNVCAEQYYTPTSTGQDIHPLLPNIVENKVVLILYIDQIAFILRRHKRYFFNSLSILSLSIFTRNSAALYALSNICGTYCFCTSPHIYIYILN